MKHRQPRPSRLPGRPPRSLIAGTAALVVGTCVGLVPHPADATTTPLAVTGIAAVNTAGKAAATAFGTPDLSDGGRFVTFTSASSVLVDGDTNGANDVFVRDTLASTTTRISVASNGTQANGASGEPSISADGRWVAFRSEATNLGDADTNGVADIFVHDRLNRTTWRVSLTNNGGQATGESRSPSISDDGTRVAFVSAAADMITAPDTNNADDVFVRMIPAGITVRASICDFVDQLAGNSSEPAISGDGLFVAFTTDADCSADADGSNDVYRRNIDSQITNMVSRNLDGDPVPGAANHPDISGNGKYVTFETATEGIDDIKDEGDFSPDVYVRNMDQFANVRASLGDDDTILDAGATDAHISRDGTRVVFTSSSTDAVAGDTNGKDDIFVRDLPAGITLRTSVRTNGDQGLNGAGRGVIAPDGSATAFQTTNALATADTNGLTDTYYRAVAEHGPFADSGALVDAVYADLYGRAPNAAERSARVFQLDDGVRSPSSLIDEALHDPYGVDIAKATRLYWAFFHRVPDKGGLDFWVTKLEEGRSLNWISQFFSQSKEFKATYGNVTNAGFVKLVYNNVLDREPDAAGLAFWIDKMNNTLSRGGVMTNFSESPEGREHMRPPVDTILANLGMIRTLPTADDMSQGAKVLGVEGQPPTEELIRVLLIGDGYAARF